MIMIRSAERQDVRIVYDLNSQALCLGPSHFVAWLGGVVLTIERELTILRNDVAHRGRPAR